MSDLWAAARLPGQALAAYLAIRHQCDLTRKATVTLPRALLEHFGIDKDAKARALKSLSAAGLIQVIQHRGKSARISLREPPRIEKSSDVLRGEACGAVVECRQKNARENNPDFVRNVQSEPLHRFPAWWARTCP
ncbi:hypothetical protein [Bradyrhizobium sp. AS23.2]|uniref:hypothetical protein n=1 Tax=Bradyrhizobium sp. AS23.2 TaxID=1680155 RepID=UPI0011612BF8|nr:hypothetical protein [Bradyrhizobium sp. AS23.2]